MTHKFTSAFVEQLHSVGGDRKKAANVLISSKDLMYDAFSFAFWNVRYIAYSVNVISERPSFILVNSVLSVCAGRTANGDTTFVMLQPGLTLVCHGINHNTSEDPQRLTLGGLQQ